MKAGPAYAGAVCRARDLIAELQIEEPREIAVEKIAAFKGAPVRFAPLAGCDGRMSRADGLAIITVRNSIERVGQQRFVIAHELGHVLLHPNIRQIDEVDAKQTRNFSLRQEPEELEANYFAAEILMPRVFFAGDAERTEPTWDSITTLAQKYQTTRSATAIRYIHHTREAVFLIASDGGDRSWYVYSDLARDFFLREATQLHRYTCARELLDKGIGHSRSEKVPAGAWFDRYDPNGKENVVEDSIRAAGSSFVLTLVWVRDDI